MESPFHHFFDDRTDAATLDALMRGPIGAPVNTKTTGRHHPGDKTADVSRGPLVKVRTMPS